VFRCNAGPELFLLLNQAHDACDLGFKLLDAVSGIVYQYESADRLNKPDEDKDHHEGESKLSRGRGLHFDLP
jgi:hypothetical protein